ncbi:MAG: S41 family peptidase [Rikenellaceae bacterium]
MEKISKYTVLATAVIAIVAAVMVGMIVGRVAERKHTQDQLGELFKGFTLPQTPQNKLSYTISLIESQYVDPVVMDSLAEKVIPSLIEELDPHSSYIPAKDMQKVNEPLDGEFEGVGIVFNMATDTVIVLNVISGGPSDKAGVKGRDRIIKINDSIVAGRKIEQSKIVKQLRGKRGSTVRLSLERQGIDDLVDVEVTRDVIPIKSVGATFMLADSIGFLQMSQFARNTHRELVEGIKSLKAQGMKKLILDLRGNSGGYLDQAILIANEFLPKGTLLVYTEDRAGEQIREYSDGRGTIQDLEIVVLINEGSASSSEILAGAIQDNDRGTIIGRRSFGKGLVQRQIPFPDGSALRLTTARYYTPTGRSIQKPYTLGDGKSYEDELSERVKHQELFHADSIHFVDSLKKITPKGKVVYGGGGIMPDIFVPVDTTSVSKYFVEVSGRNILYHYTIKYSDKHREKLNAIKTVDELHNLLDNDKDLFPNFIAYASRKGVKRNNAEIKQSKALIEAQLKAYIGRNTPLEDNGFYANIYVVDEIMLKALEVLQSKAENNDK